MNYHRQSDIYNEWYLRPEILLLVNIDCYMNEQVIISVKTYFIIIKNIEKFDGTKNTC